MTLKKITISFVAPFDDGEEDGKLANKNKYLGGADIRDRLDGIRDRISPWTGGKSAPVYIEFGTGDVVGGELVSIDVEDFTAGTPVAQPPKPLTKVLREVQVRPGHRREWQADHLSSGQITLLTDLGWQVDWRQPGGPYVVTDPTETPLPKSMLPKSVLNGNLTAEDVFPDEGIMSGGDSE